MLKRLNERDNARILGRFVERAVNFSLNLYDSRVYRIMTMLRGGNRYPTHFGYLE